jgi:hypothetical protein
MLRSLLLTPDENTIRVIGRVFKDLEVELEHFSEPSAALACATKNRFDAIVIDDAISQITPLLNKFLDLPSCNKSVRIVLAEADSAMDPIFKAGTQIILYKPLSTDRVRQGLRAVRNLMARDRRRGAKRVRAMLQARMRFGRMSLSQILISDISDTGAALRCEPADLQSCGKMSLELALTGEHDSVHATAELVWQDNEGNAGVHFIDMASGDRKRLARWLSKQSDAKARAAHFGI